MGATAAAFGLLLSLGERVEIAGLFCFLLGTSLFHGRAPFMWESRTVTGKGGVGPAGTRRPVISAGLMKKPSREGSSISAASGVFPKWTNACSKVWDADWSRAGAGLIAVGVGTKKG